MMVRTKKPLLFKGGVGVVAICNIAREENLRNVADSSTPNPSSEEEGL